MLTHGAIKYLTIILLLLFEYNYGHGILAVTCHSIELRYKVTLALSIRNLTFCYSKTCRFDAD
jgi:hypothetical protein